MSVLFLLRGELMEIQYRLLNLQELDHHLLMNFNRYQETNEVWFKEGNLFTTKQDHFIDDWDGKKKREVIVSLIKCSESGGAVVGAFTGEHLVGFANVESARFGMHNNYIELPYIHVSNDYRNLGIGRKLFQLCCEQARRLGAKKLYIAAHPSIETQQFYKSMGCTYAKEINETIFEKEPLDIQLEFLL